MHLLNWILMQEYVQLFRPKYFKNKNIALSTNGQISPEWIVLVRGQKEVGGKWIVFDICAISSLMCMIEIYIQFPELANRWKAGSGTGLWDREFGISGKLPCSSQGCGKTWFTLGGKVVLSLFLDTWSCYCYIGAPICCIDPLPALFFFFKMGFVGAHTFFQSFFLQEETFITFKSYVVPYHKH